MFNVALLSVGDHRPLAPTTIMTGAVTRVPEIRARVPEAYSLSVRIYSTRPNWDGRKNTVANGRRNEWFSFGSDVLSSADRRLPVPVAK